MNRYAWGMLVFSFAYIGLLTWDVTEFSRGFVMLVALIGFLFGALWCWLMGVDWA